MGMTIILNVTLNRICFRLILFHKGHIKFEDTLIRTIGDGGFFLYFTFHTSPIIGLLHYSLAV